MSFSNCFLAKKGHKKGTRRSECPKEPVCLDCLDFFFASASLYLCEKYNCKCSRTDSEEDPDVVHLVTGRRIRIRLLLSSNNLKLNRYGVAVLEGNGDCRLANLESFKVFRKDRDLYTTLLSGVASRAGSAASYFSAPKKFLKKVKIGVDKSKDLCYNRFCCEGVAQLVRVPA